MTPTLNSQPATLIPQPLPFNPQPSTRNPPTLNISPPTLNFQFPTLKAKFASVNEMARNVFAVALCADAYTYADTCTSRTHAYTYMHMHVATFNNEITRDVLQWPCASAHASTYADACTYSHAYTCTRIPNSSLALPLNPEPRNP